MTPAFITVTRDNGGGPEVIDLFDISRFSSGRGEAKGIRVRFKDGTTIDYKDDAERIGEAMRDAGIMRS
jgi:hypothetical protein